MLSLTRTFLYLSLLLVQPYALQAALTIPKSTTDSRAGGQPGTPGLNYYDNLELQVKSSSAQVAELESELSKLESQHDQLQSIITDLTAKNEALTTQAKATEALEKENQSLKDQVTTLQAAASAPQTQPANTKAHSEKEASLTQELADLRLKFDNLTKIHNTLVEESSQTSASQAQKQAAAYALARRQWENVDAGVAAQLQEPLQAILQITSALQETFAPTLKKALSGKRVSIKMLHDLQTERDALQHQIDGFKDVPNRQAEFNTAQEALQAQLKVSADTIAQKDADAEELQSHVQQLQAERDELEALVTQLQTASSAPAHQMRAVFVTYQHLVASSLNEFKTQINATGQRLNQLVAYITQSQATKTNLQALGRSINAFCENVKEYINHVGSTLRASGSGGSTDDQATTRTIQELHSQVNNLMQQYQTLRTSADGQIAALQAQLKDVDLSSGIAVQRLEDRLQEQEKSVAQQALQAQLKDVELSAKLSSLHDAQTRNTMEDQRDRFTDSAIAGSRFEAQQNASMQANMSAIQASMNASQASATALTTAIARSASGGTAAGPTVVTVGTQPNQAPALSPDALTWLQRTGSQQPVITPAMLSPGFMSSLPQGAASTVNGLMSMQSQMQAPTSIPQAQQQMMLAVQNHSLYVQMYKPTVSSMQNPALDTRALNNFWMLLRAALNKQIAYLYMYGQNGSQAQRSDATAKLNDLMTTTINPLMGLQNKLAANGGGLTPPPEEIASLITGYLRGWQSFGPSMPPALGAGTMLSY